MTDIIERLRIESRREPHEPIWRDAIDEIEALRELEEREQRDEALLRQALEALEALQAENKRLLDEREAAEKENTKLREALAQKVTSETMLRDLSVGNVSINAEQSEISASISLNKLSVKQLKDLLNKMDDSIQLSFTDLKFILEDNHVT